MKSALLQLKVEKLIKDTPDAQIMYLREISGKEITFTPGQFLTLIFDDNGNELRRCYSIFTTPSELPLLGIAIKKVEGGVVSDRFLEEIKEGDILSSLIPMGSFTIAKAKSDHITLYGAGSGITPLFSILKHHLESGDKKSATLVYQNRNESSVIFSEQIAGLEKIYSGRFSVVHILSRPSDNWKGHTGRIDGDFIKNLLMTDLSASQKNNDVFLCGPEQMMTTIMNTLETYGFSRCRLHREYYTLSIKQDTFLDVEPAERDVTVIYNGKSYNLKVPPKTSILEQALEEGIDLPYSCQIGSCSSCMTKLVSGKILLLDQSVLSDEEIRQGFCLTCVGFPVSDDVIVNYDDPSLP